MHQGIEVRGTLLSSLIQVLSFGSCDTEIAFLPESKIPKDFESMIEEKSEEDAARSMAEVSRCYLASEPQQRIPHASCLFHSAFDHDDGLAAALPSCPWSLNP